MKKIILLIVFCIFLPIASHSDINTIAVLDFKASGVSNTTAKNISELIRTEMVNYGQYTIIERSEMKSILKEQSLQMSGCVDVKCAVQAGKLLSAQKILVGSVMKMGNKYHISGRIVDIEKGKSDKGATHSISSLNHINNGIKQLLAKLIRSAKRSNLKTLLNKDRNFKNPHEGFWKVQPRGSLKAKAYWKLKIRNGKLYGYIINYLGMEKNETCTKCNDQFYNKPVVGTSWIQMNKYDSRKKKWDKGFIVDIGNGKKMRAEIWLKKGKLKVRGYAGMFHRTMTWHRTTREKIIEELY